MPAVSEDFSCVQVSVHCRESNLTGVHHPITHRSKHMPLSWRFDVRQVHACMHGPVVTHIHGTAP